MSHLLDQGSSPDGMVAQTLHGGNRLIISHAQTMAPIVLSAVDMAYLVRYWLTNTDLVPDDPRVALVEEIKGYQQLPGHNPGGIAFQPSR